MRTLTILSVCVMMLSGCSTFSQAVPNKTVPTIPANLTTPCDSLDVLGDNSTMGDLVKYTVDLMAKYNECAMRHDNLVKATEK